MGLKLIVLPTTMRHIVIGAIILIVLLVRGSQLFLSGNKNTITLPGAERDYGIAGGTICPNCHRPFPLSLMMLKLGFGTRFTRCPYCGRRGFFSRRSQSDLREAEAAELADANSGQAIHEKSQDEKTREMLDDSRFTDKM